ncbi:VanZ family protein [Actinophytocola oryzae]|uniref:Glycopeptide antibiotics resistance protein n=1 Tax=Actinophytocola oryzae TaxID=502181 RepID=A0A4R7W348_9PSEU|nr:VanZ family protein [Actinophytocola oryzae]TDV56468.1 glycopeptide antibiotics resistance protein [Actinophytocola oryzae]
MESRVLPAVIAVVGGMVLAVLLLVPFIYRTYRRRGELGFGAGLVAFGFLVYGFALVAYTLLPLPPLDAAWCTAHTRFTHAQLDPFAIMSDIRQYPGVLTNPAVQQGAFNVVLFLPLGAYLRLYLRRRGVPTIVLAGFLVSLLIECTQRSGNWFLFPCPYRLFDVDDLVANTLGTALGILGAPLLRRLQGTPALPADAPRPITTGRRLLGMLVDLLGVALLGMAVNVAVSLTAWYTLEREPGNDPLTEVVLSTWLPAVLLLALPAFAPAGATFGQRAVRLRRVRSDGRHPGVRLVPALLVGTFGYYVLTGLGDHVPGAGPLAFALLVASAVLAWRPRSHRGLSGLASGLVVVDARTAPSRDGDREAEVRTGRGWRSR